MNGKLVILAVGVGIGFLLGSRAGRGPYEKVAKCTKEFWEDPRVQRQVDRTVAFANDKVEDLAEIVSTGTRNVVHRMTAPKPVTAKPGASRGTTKSSTAKSPATRSAAKSSGAKSSSASKADAGD